MANALQDYQNQKNKKQPQGLNPLQSAYQAIHNFGQGVDQLGSNVYNGIRNATMGFDQTFGIPDSRIPQQQLMSPLQNPLAHAPAEAQVNPTQQVTPMPSATPSPMQQPQGGNTMFPNFTTAPVPPKYAPLIYNSAKQAGVDPNVFASLLFSEHGFSDTPGYNYNTDGSYDRGIAQINNKAHPNITDQQALDPEFAIPYAASLLGHHVKYFNGDYKKGIAAYNVGEGGAQNPQTFNTSGKAYLQKVSAGLSPQLLQQLGL